LAPTSVQHSPYRGHLPVAFGVGRIDDVERKIRFRHLLERGTERRDERMREAIDEPDRVGDEQFAPIRQPHLPHERVERHEQRVGRPPLSHSSAD
jgi:hypothetical protein